MGQVHDRRTKREFMRFCQALAAQYPDAPKIRLVLDNLNTHNASSFYAHVPADEAFVLAQRLEFHYTPIGASWLNMIECAFSVVSRQCLDRRIATVDRLSTQVLALLAERSAKGVKIHWQFSIQAARSKLHAHYVKIHPENEQYKKT